MSDESLTSSDESLPSTERLPNKLVRGLSVLFIVLLGLSIAGVGYWIWQQMRSVQIELDQNQYDVQQLRRQLGDQSEPLSQLLDQSAAMKKDFEEQQISQRLLEEQQHDTSEHLNDLTERFNQFTVTEKTDWLLTEMESLLKLADQHLELTYDVNGAMRLLDRSAELCQFINEPGALEVRQAILNDKHRLASTGQVDIEGIFLELGALADQVPQLGLPATHLSQSVEAPKVLVSNNRKTAASSSSSWHASVRSMWSELMTLFSERLVRVRRVDEPIQPLLPPNQRMYLEQNLILLLEQAQLAVLQRESRHYALSLAQAQRWIEKYFDVGQTPAHDMLATLVRLQNNNIHPVLPHITESMNALQSFKRVWFDTKKQRQLQSERMHANQEKVYAE